jgi:hypothetical protein
MSIHRKIGCQSWYIYKLPIFFLMKLNVHVFFCVLNNLLGHIEVGVTGSLPTSFIAKVIDSSICFIYTLCKDSISNSDNVVFNAITISYNEFFVLLHESFYVSL